MGRRLTLLMVACCLALALSGHARAAGSTRSPIGAWQIGQGGAVVRIASCDHGKSLCGHIVGIMLDRGTAMPSDWQGRSQCGFELIRSSRQNGRQWQGRIVNPRNGDRYGVEFHVDRAGNLALRGYLGLPIFGETQHWMRWHGPIPSSCRINQIQFAAGSSTTADRDLTGRQGRAQMRGPTVR